MRIALSLFLALILLTACASNNTPLQRTVQSHFAEAEELFDAGDYIESIRAWETVRDSFYSPELNLIAEMKIGQAYFNAEKYPEAAAAFEDFLKQHPNADRVPDALYYLGQSYYHQILSADRDQTATRNALATFQDLIKRFPNDPRTGEARRYTERCRDRLADNELYVARFYLRTEQPKAAIGRLEDLFRHYPSYSARDKAWFYLGEAYLRNGNRDKGVAAFDALKKEFPGSEFTAKAQDSLEDYY